MERKIPTSADDSVLASTHKMFKITLVGIVLKAEFLGKFVKHHPEICSLDFSSCIVIEKASLLDFLVRVPQNPLTLILPTNLAKLNLSVPSHITLIYKEEQPRIPFRINSTTRFGSLSLHRSTPDRRSIPDTIMIHGLGDSSYFSFDT